VYYLLLKTIHILSVILALGSNLTYGFLTYKAEQEPVHLVYTLKTIRWIDRNVANRSYIITLISGLLIVWNNGYTFQTFWIWLSMVIFALIAFLGITVYSPIIRKQIQLAEQNQMDTTLYKKIRNQSQTLGVAVMVLVVIILILMVTQPQ
jgi:uncharacterized membrane protein